MPSDAAVLSGNELADELDVPVLVGALVVGLLQEALDAGVDGLGSAAALDVVPVLVEFVAASTSEEIVEDGVELEVLEPAVEPVFVSSPLIVGEYKFLGGVELLPVVVELVLELLVVEPVEEESAPVTRSPVPPLLDSWLAESDEPALVEPASVPLVLELGGVLASEPPSFHPGAELSGGGLVKSASHLGFSFFSFFFFSFLLFLPFDSSVSAVVAAAAGSDGFKSV